jgi:hypothetical protein
MVILQSVYQEQIGKNSMEAVRAGSAIGADLNGNNFNDAGGIRRH